MKKIVLTIPSYDSNKGLQYHWEDGFDITVRVVYGTVQILANEAGLKSLANHLLNLAQEEVPTGHHMHFDDYNSLEGGSVELIVAKTKE